MLYFVEMRYVKLVSLDRVTLENGYKNHSKFHFRQRCKALLLSDEGWSVKDIAKLFHTRTRTIYTWMSRWESMGIVGLMILPGRGIKPKLSTLDTNLIEMVKKKTRQFARSLKKIAQELSKDFGYEVTIHMLRRFLKKMGYSWKRFRKSLKKYQDEANYKEKLRELKDILNLHKLKYIDLFFADESGFNMEGYIPYGWQPKGEYIHITPCKTPSTQIFGLMSLDNRLEAYSNLGSMTSKTVIAYIDDFCKQIKQPTVVVLDNASIHHSKIFEAKIDKWKEQGLYIFFLPKYSPHLNPIEILWRKLKYEWIKYEDIESQQELNQVIEQILTEFGSLYNINFKEHAKEVSNIFI